MITNIPTEDDLSKVALRLYFRAWTELMAVLETLGPGIANRYAQPTNQKSEEEQWVKEDKARFLKGSQPDLQVIYTMVQQSQELALKARICGVSPYALLIGCDPRSFSSKDKDFADFRTVDAADLPNLVDALCDEKLPPQFRSTYDQVRRNRNKIYHLGLYDKTIDPMELLGLLVNQYRFLFSRRSWLSERLRFAQSHRHAMFHDKWSNEYTEVISELATLTSILTKRQFLDLFGWEKNSLRYLCYHCHGEAREASITTVKTAVLNDRSDRIECALCAQQLPVMRKPCSQQDCQGELIASKPYYPETCLSCGYIYDEHHSLNSVQDKIQAWAAHHLAVSTVCISGARTTENYQPASPLELTIVVNDFDIFGNLESAPQSEMQGWQNEIESLVNLPVTIERVLKSQLSGTLEDEIKAPILLKCTHKTL